MAPVYLASLRCAHLLGVASSGHWRALPRSRGNHRRGVGAYRLPGVRTAFIGLFSPSHSPSSHGVLPWPGDTNLSRAHKYPYVALSLVGPTNEQLIHNRPARADRTMEQTLGVGQEQRSKG